MRIQEEALPSWSKCRFRQKERIRQFVDRTSCGHCDRCSCYCLCERCGCWGRRDRWAVVAVIAVVAVMAIVIHVAVKAVVAVGAVVVVAAVVHSFLAFLDITSRAPLVLVELEIM